MSFLVDTHVHLDVLSPDTLITELDAARRCGVRGFVVPGVARSGWSGLVSLAQSRDDIWCAPGLHPLCAREWSAPAAAELEAFLHAPCCVALGEVGLDAESTATPEEQEEALRGQLRLAVAAGRPVLLHCRRAFDRLFRILDQEGAEKVGGILHAFSGSVATAREALRRNLAIGCGGVVTWPEARRVAEAIRTIPAESLVLESDAPDLTPHPWRGTPNRPVYLAEIARRLAEVRGWSFAESCEITTRNARRTLHLPESDPEDH